MDSLTSLRSFLNLHNHIVTDFKGYTLTCEGSVYSLALDQFYKDGEPISQKELIIMFAPPKRKHKE